jgi:carboxylate-amine ligase
MKQANFTHGIEQEIQVVDPDTGKLVGKVDFMLSNLKGSWGSTITRDHYDTQLEIVTGISDDFDQIKKGLPNLRAKAYETAEGCGVGLIATGVNPISSSRSNENFGEHHHIGVKDAGEKVRVSNLIRNFIPELMALTVNSPYYEGHETGFMSTRVFRSKHIKIPPRVSVDSFESWKINPKPIEDKLGGNIRYWDVTPFTENNLPTVEVRLFDTQISISYSLGIAILLEAIALKAKKMSAQNITPPKTAQNIIEHNRFQAIIHGLKANFRVDTGVEYLKERETFSCHCNDITKRGGEIPAVRAVEDLMCYIETEIEEIGGKEEIKEILHALKIGDSPAAKQIKIEKFRDVRYLAKKLMEETKKGEF